MYRAPQVCVGQPGILFFEHAEKSNGGSPCLVTGATSDGVLQLAVFKPGWNVPTHKNGVRYINDPELARNFDVAVAAGGWDYCDLEKKRLEAEDRAEQAALKDNWHPSHNPIKAGRPPKFEPTQKTIGEVIGLSENGFNADYISGTLSVPLDETQYILDKYSTKKHKVK